MRDPKYCLLFSLSPAIGPKRFIKLIKFFGTSQSAWNGSKEDFKKLDIGKKTFAEFEKFRISFDIKLLLQKLQKLSIEFVCKHDKFYPKDLLKLDSPPIVLYTRGDKNLLKEKNKIAIVGTRKITSYGKGVTEKIASDLAVSGVVIVSGMALGVDATAHKVTLVVKGKTIAVLGSGIDVAYPRENQVLYRQIVECGLVISEYPPGVQSSKGTFPARNRIIAAISTGTLVTEAAKDSGSLITATYAKKLEKKVFAVPGPITSLMSQGTLKLIKEGAQVVSDASDILKSIGKKEQIGTSINMNSFSKDEQKVAKALQKEEVGIDELSKLTGINISSLVILLSGLELKGVIRQGGGKYAIRNL